MTLPRRTAHLLVEAVRLEVAIYRSLARWLTRRPDVPAGTDAIGYAQLATPVIWLWILASAAEVVVVHVIVPWDAVRLALLVVGIWGLLWMLGLLAGMRVRPHLVDRETLRIRNGPRTEIGLPLAAIDTVRRAEHGLPGIRTVHVDGERLLVGVSSRTNLEVLFTAPQHLSTPHGPVSATAVAFWVDEPREAAELLRRRRPAPSR